MEPIPTRAAACRDEALARRTPRAAWLFDVQRFCLHDGPGIRTTVFFKGCPLQCRWCQNPESHKPRPEMAFYTERCQGCWKCADVCPQGAIARRPDRRIDFARCDTCGACAAVCPRQAVVTVGEAWTVERLVAELLKDRDYFDDSGGGITLSGGEPMAQPAYLARLLPELKAAHLHITLETCGHFAWRQIEPLLAHLDLIYFDLKHMAPETHAALTGVDNRRIGDNFIRLARAFTHLQARMPLVPGLNDDTSNLCATARFLRRNHQERIHCLPYHRLGEAKLGRIQTTLPPLGLAPTTPADRQRVRATFAEEGIHAVIYD